MPPTPPATAAASKNAKDNPKDIAYQTTRPGDLVIKPSVKTYGPSSTSASARDEINKYWTAELPKAHHTWPLEHNRPWRGHLVAVSLQGESRTPAILRVADVTKPDNGYGPELVLYVRIPRATANPLGLKTCTRENARYFHLENAAAKRLLCNLKISPFDAASARNGKAQHHPYALSLLISMHAIGDLRDTCLGELDAHGKPVLACNEPAAFVNGGLTVVCLPPLSAELEKCLILMGHSLAVGPLPKPPAATAASSTNSDDAESTASDDVPLSNRLDPVWGSWQAKTAQAGNQFRECTQELHDLSKQYPLKDGDSVLNYTIPLLSSRSSAVGQHILQSVMEQFAGGGKKATSSSGSSSSSSAKPPSSKSAPAATKTPPAKKPPPPLPPSVPPQPPAATPPVKRVTFAPTTPTQDDDDNSESWDIGETPVEPSPPPSANGRDGGAKRARNVTSGDKGRKTRARRGGSSTNDEGDLCDDDDEDFSDVNMSSEEEDDDDDDSDDDSEEEEEEEDEENASSPPSVVAATAHAQPPSQSPPPPPPPPPPPTQPIVCAPFVDEGTLRHLVLPELHRLIAPDAHLLGSSEAVGIGEKVTALEEALSKSTTQMVPSVLMGTVIDLAKALHALAERRDALNAAPTIGTVAMPAGEASRIRAMARDAHTLGSETLPLVGDALRDVRKLEQSLVHLQKRGSEVLETIAGGVPAAPP